MDHPSSRIRPHHLARRLNVADQLDQFRRAAASVVLQPGHDGAQCGVVPVRQAPASWRDKAASLPEDNREREHCIVIAEGYEALAATIEATRRASPQKDKS